jgi:hypothetical protein
VQPTQTGQARSCSGAGSLALRGATQAPTAGRRGGLRPTVTPGGEGCCEQAPQVRDLRAVGGGLGLGAGSGDGAGGGLGDRRAGLIAGLSLPLPQIIGGSADLGGLRLSDRHTGLGLTGAVESGIEGTGQLDGLRGLGAGGVELPGQLRCLITASASCSVSSSAASAASPARVSACSVAACAAASCSLSSAVRASASAARASAACSPAAARAAAAGVAPPPVSWAISSRRAVSWPGGSPAAAAGSPAGPCWERARARSRAA